VQTKEGKSRESLCKKLVRTGKKTTKKNNNTEGEEIKEKTGRTDDQCMGPKCDSKVVWKTGGAGLHVESPEPTEKQRTCPEDKSKNKEAYRWARG